MSEGLPDHAKTAADLQWRALLDIVAGFAASQAAGDALRSLEPASNLEVARARNERTGLALEALERGVPVPSVAVGSLQELLDFVGKGGQLTGEQLHELRLLGRHLIEQRGYLRELRPVLPELAERLSFAPSDALHEALDRSLDETGHLVDGASSTLKQLRGQVRRARQQLQEELSRQAAKLGDVLRDGSWVERDGRFGLPVRSDTHRKIEGIVLGASATGATLYVEPPPVTSRSNRLRVVEAEVQREEARIFHELSALATKHHEALEQGFQACVETDRLAALTKFARSRRARVLPLTEASVLRLEHVRHPLLQETVEEVVPNDVRLEAGRALIVSGPNAGGKTVVLKCLGLIAWMARSGLPLPVGAESQIGWFATVLTDIGDSQSIERSLSTFSAEVEAIRQSLARADGQTLILLDEVAGGTDPEEGAALATAVLEALADRGAAVAVTTHYERLKELAAEDPRFVNASVGFDFDGMRPTFQLTMGRPGASSALAVASRLGLDPRLIARAKDRLSVSTRRREELIAELEREKVVAERARREAEHERAIAARHREVIEAEREGVREKERKKIARETAELMTRVKRARATLEAVQQDVRQGGLDPKRAQRQIDEAARLAAVGGPLERASTAAVPEPQPPPPLEVGAKVWVGKLKAEAVIESPPEGDTIRVRAGLFSLKVGVDDLSAPRSRNEPDPKESPRRKSKKTRSREPLEPVANRAIRTEDNTCDLRGMRVDEALEALDRFIDRSLGGGGEPLGFVLHGHGTGALKKAVREHLSGSPYVRHCRPAESGEGGDAFTVFHTA
ncbi:MAG: Smr/MutS family protein [Myxococcota bacterium]